MLETLEVVRLREADIARFIKSHPRACETADVIESDAPILAGMETYGFPCEESGMLLAMGGLQPRLSSLNLWYVVAPSHVGNGVATEFVSQMLTLSRVLTARYGVALVSAQCRVENRASARVLQKSGFEQVKTAEGWSSVARSWLHFRRFP